MLGTVAPAGAATTESFALTSAAVSGQSSVTWQGPPVNPPSTPNLFPDATSPISLSGQIDSATGDISGASLSFPPIGIVGQGQQTYFAFSDSGGATGNFDSSTGAVSLNDALTLTFTVPNSPVGLIECVSTPIDVALLGTWDATSQNVTLATTSSFTIPQFPADSGQNCSLANSSLNASPGGTAGSVGNAMTIALNGQFAPGLPTTTTLSASPDSPQLAGTAVTLTATVADPSAAGTPTGNVTFVDNGASLGTEALDDTGTATLSTTDLPSGAGQQLTAAYGGDPSYAVSTSSALSYTITPLPTIGANLPASMTVPSATIQPTVSGLSPDAGPTAGGATVTITGSGFTPKSTVRFGSKTASDVTFDGSTQLTATSPAGTGTVDVVVSNGSGTSDTSFADTFAYGAPSVTAVNGNVGPVDTSFEVIITGTGFTPSATVDFGSIAAAAVQVNSPTSIYAFSPKDAAGTVDVTVTSNAGTSTTSSADHYTYAAAPAVASLGTPAGPTTGGTSVTISGDNFSGVTAVDFGSTPATSFTVNAAGTSITAVSPPGSADSVVDVTVTTPSGTSAKWLFDRFTYGPPTVTGVSPAGGPAAGGTMVTITGTGFAPSASLHTVVKFGTGGSEYATVTSPTSLTATALAGSGTVDVTVTTGGGTSATSPADQFTYAPTVSAISPPSGPVAGSTSVSIAGSGFTGASAVSFGASAAASFTVDSDAQITAIAPKGTNGATADVTVTTTGGTSATSPADQFFYGAPTVTAVAPNAGPPGGGTDVTITGTGFSGATAVKFGSTSLPTTDFTVVSPTQITAVSPAGSGTAHVTITTDGGTSSSGAGNEFIYSSAPSVHSLTPNTGAQGTGVTIAGGNFTAANGVYFGSVPAASFTVVNDSTITATAPAGSDSVDVTVTSAAGTSATGPGDVFAYGPPTVTNVAPDAGSISGGTSVVLTGTGFVSGTTVSFGSTPAASVTISSPTSITAVSPAQGASAVDVTVTNPGGTSATSPADVFTYSTGGSPGQASLTVTNPATGQSWSSLYLEVVLALNDGTSRNASKLPPSDVTLSYQDTAGAWRPLTLTASGTGTGSKPYLLTGYFSGVGNSCDSAPGSFSLAPGATLSIPIQLSYASDAYVGAQMVTATLYSGTCSGPTSCSQAGALDGGVAGSSTIQLAPPARLPATVTDLGSLVASSSVRQGFEIQLRSKVSALQPAGTTPQPTGTVAYLVDGNPISLTADGSTPAPNPAPLSVKSTQSATDSAYYSTTGLLPGTYTLTEEYSGDSVFSPATLTETFTVLPAPAGTPYSCDEASSFTNSIGYVTATSSPPAPTSTGSNATVSDVSVSADLDPTVFAEFGGGSLGSAPTTFSLSPGGSMAGNGVEALSATDDLWTWSGMSTSVLVTGEPGSAMTISVRSLDYQYVTSFATNTITCTPISTDAQVTSVTVAGNTLSASPAGSAAPGTPVTLTDTVAPTPSSNPGTVTFYDGSNVLGAVPVDPTTGTATYPTNQLALGDHQLSAQWSGTLSIPPTTSNTVTYQVGTTSSTTLASSANPANAAHPVTFTATVSGPEDASTQPTGDVSFTSDGSPITSCQDVGLSTASPPTATCTVSLGAGETHAIVATYSGDGTYVGSTSDALTQSTLPGTNTSIISTKDPSPPGKVTFWAGVSPKSVGTTPAGTVAFSIDGSIYKPCNAQPLGPGGGASCAVSFKAGTSHKVSATYAGSATYSGSSSSTITQTVTSGTGATGPKDTGGSATLGSAKSLTAGQSIATGTYKLAMQRDGNLVEYQGSKARWASHTAGHPGTGVVMQRDGNLVEYFHGHAIWSSNTWGHPGAHLVLQGTDGNVVIYQGTTALWSTGT